MANYNDYQLDEMENAAMEKRKNLKRGLVAGTAVLGAGGTAAIAAAPIINPDPNPEEVEVILTDDDLLAGANAGAEDQPQQETDSTQQTTTQTVNETREFVIERVETQVIHEPNVSVDETAVFYDENGDVMMMADQGTIDGVQWIAVDKDLNGKADYIGIDENQNGIIEENEIYAMDNQSFDVGKGNMFAGYSRAADGQFHKDYEVDNHLGKHVAYNEGQQEDIHNDWDDERSGERYHDDLAENNIDYNNRGGEQYNASMSAPEPENNYVAHETEQYVNNGSEEMYAYSGEQEVYEQFDQDDLGPGEGNYVADYESNVAESYDDTTNDWTADADDELYDDATNDWTADATDDSIDNDFTDDSFDVYDA